MAHTKSDYATGKRNLPQPDGACIDIIPVLLILGATAPVVGDTIELVNLQPGVELVDYAFISPQLDSNGAPVLACQLGSMNAGKTDLGVVYGTAAIGAGANGSVVRNTEGRALVADASVDRSIAIKWTVAAATWAGANKRLLINLHLRA